MRIENLSRRGFLKGVASTSVFVLGVSLLPEDLLAAGTNVGTADPGAPMKNAALQVGVYLAIDTDGSVYIIAHRSEMGNGVRTALPRIVAEVLYRIEHRRAQGFWKEAGLRRIGRRGVETGSAEERRFEVKAAERLALHR